MQPLEAKVKALEKKLEKQIETTNFNPIFFAKRIDIPHKEVPFGDGCTAPLWYDEVVVNTDKSLEAQFGVFTAPIRGYYYFQASSTVSQPGKKAELLLNKKVAISKIVPKGKHSGWFPNELQATLLLNAGDKVSVNFEASVGSRNRGITFSGFLLRRENFPVLLEPAGPFIHHPVPNNPVAPIKRDPAVGPLSLNIEPVIIPELIVPAISAEEQS